MNRIAISALAAMLAILPASAQAGIVYDIQAVPVLPGGTANYAQDINNLGQIVGNSRKNGGTALLPYVWTPGQSSPTEIGLLSGVPNFGRGFAVNDSGVVVGESGNGPSKPFEYQGGTLSDLGSMAGGSGGVAYDINNSGRAVGGASNGQSVRAFYTDGNGVLNDLGTPLGTSNSLGRAYAINESGVIAGVARNAANTASQPTLWTFDSGGNPIATTVPTLVPDGYGEFLSLNDTGTAVGRYTNATGQTRAFAFDGSTVHDLGLLPDEPTFVHSRAIDVNDAGDIVGYVARLDTAPSFGGAAVLWRNGQIFDLNDMVDPLSGWILYSAEGINELGQIVGYGSYNGQTRAFVMTPVPEPASIALMGTGIVGLWAYRCSRKSRV